MRDVAVKDQVGDLCEENVHVLRVGEGVVAAGPEGRGHLHVLDIVVRWGGLQARENKYLLLILTQLLSLVLILI